MTISDGHLGNIYYLLHGGLAKASVVCVGVHVVVLVLILTAERYDPIVPMHR